MNEILNEIDQELRQERMRQMWRQYGVYIIAGVVAIVLFVAGRQGLVAYQESAAMLLLMPIATALLDAGDEALSGLAVVMAKATPCWRSSSWLPMPQIAVLAAAEAIWHLPLMDPSAWSIVMLRSSCQ